ncbi:unnamed protein product [Spirodela intermedia]|uniref:Uncharacterized protein n=1 Tax=Spirodela intermedia TaxID=51605 RepID=A0A7I8IY56_SPIIN|nr:unnamed protein product [Spirodela intermedia]CAA6662642.1 unnamed protein product [Spirodela intermedia]
MNAAALASCSSGREPDDHGDVVASEGLDKLIRRRRRVYLDGDEQTEPEVTRRHHTRLISRWVARQVEEMITIIKQRNRESELIALAGLHTVSMLESSFLRVSRRTTPSGTVERLVVTRASSVLQRWRELEDESAGRQRRSLRELQNLSQQGQFQIFPPESHSVRMLLQSLLRGRFLRNGVSTEEERSPSMAAREIGQLRQRHPVSCLRLENSVRRQASNHFDASSGHSIDGTRSDQPQPHLAVQPRTVSCEQSQPGNEGNDDRQLSETPMGELGGTSPHGSLGENRQEEPEDERRGRPQLGEAGFSQWNSGLGEESGGHWEESIDQIWSQGTSSNRHEPEVHEWNEDETRETVENWEEEALQFLQEVNHPYLSEGSMGSTHLMTMTTRSVSNLLRSGFRERLDRLIQSYIHRQAHSPAEWDLQTHSAEDQVPGGGDRNDDVPEDSASIPLLVSPPPLPPPCHSGIGRCIPPTGLERDVVNDLRADVARLQRRMTHMQRMLEACMGLQVELQRSINQWGLVRKEACCVCCDSPIDSLLYRCGHMCACTKCANELVGGAAIARCAAPSLTR